MQVKGRRYEVPPIWGALLTPDEVGTQFFPAACPWPAHMVTAKADQTPTSDRPTPPDKPGPVPGFLRLVLGAGGTPFGSFPVFSAHG
jgi:hypothetical protein